MVKGSGKKGGIPKSFHAKQKQTWEKVGKKSGQNYFVWIAAKWKEEKGRGSIVDYAKGKKKAPAKTKPRSKLASKVNLNLPPNPWVKKWASGNVDQYKDWKKTLKKNPSKKEMLAMMKEKQWPHDAVNCWQLRRAKMNCVKKNISNNMIVKSKLRSRGFPYESWWGDGQQMAPNQTKPLPQPPNKPSSPLGKRTKPLPQPPNKPSPPSDNPVNKAIRLALLEFGNFFVGNPFVTADGEYPPPPGKIIFKSGQDCFQFKHWDRIWDFCGAPVNDNAKMEWLDALDAAEIDAWNAANRILANGTDNAQDSFHYQFQFWVDTLKRRFPKSVKPEPGLADNLIGTGVPIKPEPDVEPESTLLPDGEVPEQYKRLVRFNPVGYDKGISIYAPKRDAPKLLWVDWLRYSYDMITQAADQDQIDRDEWEASIVWLRKLKENDSPLPSEFTWGRVVGHFLDRTDPMLVGGAFSRRKYRK